MLFLVFSNTVESGSCELGNRNLAKRLQMTKAEMFDKAWKLGLKGNFSLVDKIYHQKYKAVHREVNVEVDLDADKIVMATYKDSVIFGPFRVIFENNEFLCLERHVRSTLEKEPSYNTVMSAIT